MQTLHIFRSSNTTGDTPMTIITLRTLTYKGQDIAVTTDDTGRMTVGTAGTCEPIRDTTIAGKAAFVWAGVNNGLPAKTKVTLTSAELAAYEAHRAAHIAAMRAKYAKADYVTGTSFGREEAADIAASRSSR
jgi:hypothetical protein